jgi:hypothetical protein
VVYAVVLRRRVPEAPADRYRTFLPEHQRDVVVDQHDVVLRGQHDVGRLYVGVEYAVRRLLVKVRDRLEELLRPRDDASLLEALAALEGLVQAIALDIVHDRIDHVVLDDIVVDLRDVSVAEVLQRVDLAAKRVLLRCQRALVALEDDMLIQAQVPREVDDPAAARPDFLLDLV